MGADVREEAGSTHSKNLAVWNFRYRFNIFKDSFFFNNDRTLYLMSHSACCHTCYTIQLMHYPYLTLILLMWRIGWAPNNTSKWQMGFNSAFKGLISCGIWGFHCCHCDDYCHLGWWRRVVWQTCAGVSDERAASIFRVSMEAAGSSETSVDLHICTASRPRRQ